MSNCRIELSGVSLSSERAAARWEGASKLLGEKVVVRLLAFCLFLLGAERQQIASRLGLPLGTLLSLLTRISRLGLAAFEDRRMRRSKFLPAAAVTAEATVTVGDKYLVIDLGMGRRLAIPSQNVLQVRVIVLTLVCNGVLTSEVAAEALGCTAAHVRTLCRKLTAEGARALLDQRRGQKQDYRITQEIKSELVVQVAAHALAGNSTSSTAVTDSLNERMQWQLSDRTVRLHMEKLGLAGVAESLPRVVEALKKTPRDSAGRRGASLRCDAH